MSAGSVEPSLDALDFEVTVSRTADSAEELIEAFAEARAQRHRVRLCGAASRHGRLPLPAAGGAPVALVSLRGLARITRLEPDDLTCSVEPGVQVADLQRELATHGLWLPVEDAGGTVGGLFASGDDLPPAPGAPSTRHLLLGLSGVLAEGRRFKAGAKVVKSVAGFDLQKLFVGSRGRLFAATELHLKLRPQPRHAAWFRLDGLERADAIARFRSLRRDPYPPAAVWMESDAGAGACVAGRYEGHPRVVDDRLRAHRLTASAETPRPADDLGHGLEELVGVVRPSRIEAILRSLPPNVARWSIGGTGRLVIAAPRHVVDEIVGRLAAELDVAAEVQRSPTPARRGFATPRDPAAERVMRELTAALDPESILA